jgi:hypothetical protein
MYETLLAVVNQHHSGDLLFGSTVQKSTFTSSCHHFSGIFFFSCFVGDHKFSGLGNCGEMIEVWS